ncbi:type II secretion system F family protein [Saccharomonospora sp. NPDC046836]|uniref:type II secretion system F family protein n=1 Tax=Saccharomonospora sp. NPDC046836 TaxID=3156921 RepID=UPI0033CC06DA
MSTPSVVVGLLGLSVLLAPPPPAARLRHVLPAQLEQRRRLTVAALLWSSRTRPWCAGALACLVLAALGLPLLAVPAGALAWFATRTWLSRRKAGADEPLRLAATGDLLAACLTAGLPVPTAVRAVADTAPQAAAAALHATADLLALGAEPAQAWEPARCCPATAELARAAYRTARSGSALAQVALAMAERARSNVADVAEARAQRAGVLITGPLGLCFLPAFLCLGVIPVVIGLASRLTVFA